jgi:hypothetical protein
MSQQTARPKFASIKVNEAVGKRIRELIVEGGSDPDSNDFGVSLFFDDDTQIFLNLAARLSCGVRYEREVDGEPEIVKEYPQRLLVSE